jgi:iron complex outermembrane receptor protein
VFDDGQILTNLAVYYYDYTNIQFTTYVEAGSEILNAGSATAFGTELEYQIQPHALRGWELDGSASFEDSHYGAGCFGDPANLDGAASLPLGANGLPPSQCPSGVLPVAQIKGNELIRAPRWKTNVGLQYSAELGATGNLLTRVEAAWTDTIYNDVWNGRIPDLGDWTQPGYWILNARMVWTSMDKRYSAEVFGENLTNSIYATNRSGFVIPPSVYNVSGQLGAPRIFGVKLTLRFGSATG